MGSVTHTLPRSVLRERRPKTKSGRRTQLLNLEGLKFAGILSFGGFFWSKLLKRWTYWLGTFYSVFKHSRSPILQPIGSGFSLSMGQLSCPVDLRGPRKTAHGHSTLKVSQGDPPSPDFNQLTNWQSSGHCQWEWLQPTMLRAETVSVRNSPKKNWPTKTGFFTNQSIGLEHLGISWNLSVSYPERKRNNFLSADGGFLKWGYPQFSSICWGGFLKLVMGFFPMKTPWFRPTDPAGASLKFPPEPCEKVSGGMGWWVPHSSKWTGASHNFDRPDSSRPPSCTWNAPEPKAPQGACTQRLRDILPKQPPWKAKKIQKSSWQDLVVRLRLSELLLAVQVHWIGMGI